jgi:hypothetical protein
MSTTIKHTVRAVKADGTVLIDLPVSGRSSGEYRIESYWNAANSAGNPLELSAVQYLQDGTVFSEFDF